MSKTKLCITDLALNERPREKLMEQGPAALSDAELLAILIGSGNSEETAIDLTRRILKDHHDSLSSLGRMGLEQLTAYRGMGPAKAVAIMAACELGRRRSKEIVVQHKIKSSQDIADYFQDTLRDLPHEECHMLLMRHNLTVIHETRVSIGGQSSSTVEMKTLFQKIFAANAAAIAFCHNHPSGSLTPSQADKDLTVKLQKACRLMEVSFIDHVIVSSQGFYSFHDEGLLL